MSINLGSLTPKKLLGDPAFYAAAAPLLSYFDPSLGHWLETHSKLVALYGGGLAGHFGVRMLAVHAKGKVLAQNPVAVATAQLSNPPAARPADSEKIDPTTIGLAPHETEEDYTNG